MRKNQVYKIMIRTIGELDLSGRVYRAFIRANIKTLGDIARMPWTEIRKLHNMGEKTTIEVKTKWIKYLKRQGFSEQEIQQIKDYYEQLESC